MAKYPGTTFASYPTKIMILNVRVFCSYHKFQISLEVLLKSYTAL